MTPDLRLIRYFVAVAEAENVTRAAERLHIAQPSLSAAIKQLEGQLGVELLARRGRRVTVTPVGELLLRRGRELLEHADEVVAEVRGRNASASGRLRLGLSPTARFGVGPELLAACAAKVPAIMLYTSEDTTGALLRGVADGSLDLAITFCAAARPGVDLTLVHEEPAVVHLPSDHRLAGRSSLTLEDLAGDTVLIAASDDSSGFSARVLDAFAEQGLTPRTRVDPYPDLGYKPSGTASASSSTPAAPSPTRSTAPRSSKCARPSVSRSTWRHGRERPAPRSAPSEPNLLAAPLPRDPARPPRSPRRPDRAAAKARTPMLVVSDVVARRRRTGSRPGP